MINHELEKSFICEADWGNSLDFDHTLSVGSPVQTAPAEMFQVCHSRSGCESAGGEKLCTIFNPIITQLARVSVHCIQHGIFHSKYTTKVISTIIFVLEMCSFWEQIAWQQTAGACSVILNCKWASVLISFKSEWHGHLCPPITFVFPIKKKKSVLRIRQVDRNKEWILGKSACVCNSCSMKNTVQYLDDHAHNGQREDSSRMGRRPAIYVITSCWQKPHPTISNCQERLALAKHLRQKLSPHRAVIIYSCASTFLFLNRSKRRTVI